MSAQEWIGEAEIKSKHQGYIDETAHKAVCPCGAKFTIRAYRFEAMNDLIEHYEKKGTLYRYMAKPHYKERVAA